MTGIPTVALLTHAVNAGSVVLEGIADSGRKWDVVFIALSSHDEKDVPNEGVVRCQKYCSERS